MHLIVIPLSKEYYIIILLYLNTAKFKDVISQPP